MNAETQDLLALVADMMFEGDTYQKEPHDLPSSRDFEKLVALAEHDAQGEARIAQQLRRDQAFHEGFAADDALPQIVRDMAQRWATWKGQEAAHHEKGRQQSEQYAAEMRRCAQYARDREAGLLLNPGSDPRTRDPLRDYAIANFNRAQQEAAQRTDTRDRRKTRHAC